MKWVYEYTEERRPSGQDLIEQALLRPTVQVQLLHDGEATQRFLALVDSGCDHVLAPLWIAETIGVEPDEERSFRVQIAGRDREVRLAEVDLRLLPPDDRSETAPVEWRATVGFFVRWADPPWLVLLGLLGFFDQFTIVMSRLAQRLAVLDRDQFDNGVPSTHMGDLHRDAPPRFRP